MGTRHMPPLLQGFGVPHPASLDTTALDAARSSYTESGPQPGTPVAQQTRSMLVPRIHYAQEKATTAEVVQGGMPGGSLGLTFEVDGQARGWMPPTVIRQHEHMRWSGVDVDRVAITGIAGTRTLVAVAAEAGAALRVYRFDGEAWEALADLDGTAVSAVSMAELPDGRLLLGLCDATNGTASLLYSDDRGETWAPYAASNITIPTTVNKGSMVRVGNTIVWMLLTSGNQIYHLASGDLGVTWATLGFVSSVNEVSAVAVGDALGMAYKSSTNEPRFVLFDSPFTPIDEVITGHVVIEATAVGALACAADATGIYVFAITTPEITYRSVDAGETWERLTPSFAEYATAEFQRPVACAYAGGFALWATHDDADSLNQQPMALLLGGWSSVDLSESWDLVWATGSRDPVAGGGTVAFTGSGTSDINSDAIMEITTTLSDPLAVYVDTGLAAGFTQRLLLEFAVDSGTNVGATIRLSDGVQDGQVLGVTATTTALTIRDDLAGADLGTLEIDMTEWLQVLVDINEQVVTVYTRHPTVTDDWTQLVQAEMLRTASTPIVPSIRFGNLNGAAVSRWRMYARRNEPLGDTLTGAPLTDEPLAMPHLAPTGEAMAYVSVIGGPGVVGEQWVIAPRYTYALTNALLGETPSPFREWRALNEGEQIVAWDLGGAEWLGNAWYLHLERANFRAAHLEASVDGEDWVTLVNYNGAVGFSPITWTRNGYHARPVGASNGARYIQPGELAGGFLVQSSIGLPTYRIVWNTGGHWTVNATQRPWLQLDTATSLPVNGGGSIVWPGGVAIGYAATEAAYRYVRVRIPLQVTPDNEIRVGAISWGRIDVMGQESAYGWAQRHAPNVRSDTDDWGTEYRRVRGPQRRTWTINWSDLVGTGAYRENLDADYIAVADGYPALAAVGDVWWMLTGLLAETEYARPVLFFNSLPTSDTTITDRTRYILGHLSGDVQMDGVMGNEGRDEWGRIETLTITEIR